MKTDRCPSPLLWLATALLTAAPTLAADRLVELTPLEVARSLNQAFVQVAENVSPAVVVIKLAYVAKAPELDDADSPFWDLIPRQFRKHLEEQWKKREQENPSDRNPRQPPTFSGQGSGVVIRKEGYILTNRHVIEGADHIVVVLRDGSEFPAVVRGVDAQSDVAVLKIDPRGRDLPTATLADSDQTRVGEFAIAIGAPYELDYSVTFGHVSAKGRAAVINDPAMDQDFIQTDANINPGNSGGPLVNISGEVIGINTLIRGLRTGIGFAIPSNLAGEVAGKLITDGRYVRAYLGVQISALRDHAELRQIVKDLTDGVVVSGVVQDGPAGRSDLRAGDVIIAVNTVPVATPKDLRDQVRAKPIGTELALTVHRAGKTLEIGVTSEPWPEPPAPQVAVAPSSPATRATRFGLTVESLTPDLAEQLGATPRLGLIVTEVATESEADRKGIQPGDIITAVNQKTIQTPQEFLDALKPPPGATRSAMVSFTRRGLSKFVILQETPEP